MAEKPSTIHTAQEIGFGKRKQGGIKTFAALKHRNFKLFFSGQLISVAGTWMQSIAQGWLVYQLTHSELALGVVGFASAIPVLIVSPWGGVIVDRVPKRNLLVLTQASAMMLAFILSFLSFAHVVQVWHILALAAALGVVNALDAPGRQAFVIEMVGKEDLSNAIALNSMVFNGARVVGPALGGFLLAAFGPSWCFLVNGISFLAVIFGLLAMEVKPRTLSQIRTSTLKQLSSGFQYALTHNEILAILVLAIIFSIFGTSYSAILPAFVDKMLHAGASAYGVINAISGMGAVSAAFFLASNSEAGNRGKLLAGATFLFSTVLLLFANSHSLPAALVLAFGLGVGFMLQFALMNTLLQVYVTDDMRGRVMSLYTLVVFGIAPFGNLLLGSVSEIWGLDKAIGSSAVAVALLSIIVYVTLPKLRKLS